MCRPKPQRNPVVQQTEVLSTAVKTQALRLGIQFDAVFRSDLLNGEGLIGLKHGTPNYFLVPSAESHSQLLAFSSKALDPTPKHSSTTGHLAGGSCRTDVHQKLFTHGHVFFS